MFCKKCKYKTIFYTSLISLVLSAISRSLNIPKKRFSEIHKGKIPWNKGMSRDKLKKYYPKGWNTPILKGKNHPCWKGGGLTLNCSLCGNKYKRQPHVAKYSKFCSIQCLRNYNKIRFKNSGNPNWKGGLQTEAMKIRKFAWWN